MAGRIDPARCSEQPDPRDPAAKARIIPDRPRRLHDERRRRERHLPSARAKNLRSRASSYFSKDAANDLRIRDWMPLVKDVDYIETSTPSPRSLPSADD